MTNKEYPHDFDGCYDDISINYDLLDSIFDESEEAQQTRFSRYLLADSIFQGFFQKDRDENPRGIIALDPRDI